MTPQAQPMERLEKRLARVAREQGLDQERLGDGFHFSPCAESLRRR